MEGQTLGGWGHGYVQSAPVTTGFQDILLIGLPENRFGVMRHNAVLILRHHKRLFADKEKLQAGGFSRMKFGMRRVNLNDTKLTIRVSTDAKRKAAEIAKRRGLSISQLVDELIRQAEETKLDEETLRAIVSEELDKWGGSAKEANPKKRLGR